jgi:predicted phosphohydrolase
MNGHPYVLTEAPGLRIAFTADLHFGTRHAAGHQATLQLAAHLHANPPDVLVLAGDIGTGDDFSRTLELFDRLPSTKVFTPGNHDLWVNPYDPRGDSHALYHHHLPKVAANHGFLCLDHGPLVLMEHDLALAGSVNWYDYSWGQSFLPELSPDWVEHLTAKRFTRGRHNDANFIRWPHDDAGFTRMVVQNLEHHLTEALALVSHVVVATHHPPIRELNYPRSGPLTLDAALWLCFSGNSAMEDLIHRHQPHIPAIFCGHTHKDVNTTLGATQAFNIGGDYTWKRLLTYEWPAGTCTTMEFRGVDSVDVM